MCTAKASEVRCVPGSCKATTCHGTTRSLLIAVGMPRFRPGFQRKRLRRPEVAIISVRYSSFGTSGPCKPAAVISPCKSATSWSEHDRWVPSLSSCQALWQGPRRSLRKSAPWAWTCAPVVFLVGTRFEVSRISRQKWWQQALLAEGKSSDARAGHNRTGWAKPH